MESSNYNKTPLIVIVGPTASGKTSLAINLAEIYGGEIICADSRTVYKDMDIGTAKPSYEDCQRVPHWGIDLVYPYEYFSAAEFKQYSLKKIEDIRSRNKIPFLVGGTGLYIDAIVFDYKFGNKSDVKKRTLLEKLTIEELWEYCSKNNIELPDNYNNKRYVIRCIEQGGINNSRKVEINNNIIVVGISTDRDNLRKRIKDRIEQFFDNNVVEEARILGKIYGWDNRAMSGNIYPILHKYIDNEINIEEAKVEIFYRDWHLAKRQMTWFRRNKNIEWLELNQVPSYIYSRMASLSKI
ncbi:tRNA (adenosine(37)-N6)-dimethylallyltransferase MiaA [TM7 phylum sp. oral taxon 348]|jgi:tRNA dimethylallyltransferase|nr:tRNA (adenosine(37)-N6)-dimethylallyltransferase MiaA [Candidatus Saccharibacteria bacterium]MBF1028012.1 tRNA (adenosine(37)-N6)-dimethylallyltransferase MiaA [Candidatus Nanosynbacter sp.]TWP19033.1 tRNA (adenosine(37)-N6)-dimethylallyltransferase MiaA [TM7 phylum sp. oral taxon 348]MBB1565752.1 tRNA (adenosine(37)-N6)-dimethylallyltransferase MiaA [Candidatus Saccharibacteria bacterium]TWP19571.1 tRNA (adenosine(37)-N6)-dimethylallyltransferase MiaA [TM7 phylum sp. oral taxon 348]